MLLPSCLLLSPSFIDEMMEINLNLNNRAGEIYKMFHLNDILLFLFFCIVAFVVPGTLTVWNIYNCFSATPKREKLTSTITILVGGLLYLMLFAITYDTAGDWYEQVNTMQFHYVISSGYWGISWVSLLGFAAYFVLLYINADRLPPLVSVAAISFVILLNVLQITFAVQLSKNINDPLELLFYVYHFNILLLSARAIQRHMLQQIEIFKNRAAEQDNNIRFKKFYDIINSLSGYTIVIFVTLFLVVAIIEIIFVLIGQGLDAPIKAFTDTADWTFSKQTPPPPIEYEGHYLCTVAASGHKKVVKPLRFGSRRGATIIVNRQLCIANAFEELIQIKFPSFHRMIRHIYDTYGYPLSKLITNPLRADIVYIIMKPLEWIFLLFLYLVDVRPEQRIRNQYVLQYKL